MSFRGPGWFMLAAYLSFAVAAFHVAVVFVGAPAYTYFGAPELARLVESGSLVPAAVTLSIATVFVVFGVYALSGAGVVRRLPFLAGGLVLIGSVYTLRGLSLVGQAFRIVVAPELVPVRALLYSLASLVIGCVYLVGTVKSWKQLCAKEDRR